MRAVIVRGAGGVEALEVVQVPRPQIRPDQILVRNFATALNRADLLQRRGLYPPPPGETEILGLEFSGEVAEAGERVRGLRRGDRVFGLVGGGAYAEFLAVDSRLAMPISDRLSFDAAAAIPEAFFTASESLLELGGLAEGETVLIHAGASGVGTAAIQLARAKGARVIATVGSPQKLARLVELGSLRAVDYRQEDFEAVVRELTGGRGVEVILDLVGAKHWEKSLASLASGGRWLLVGLLGGARVSVDLESLLERRARVFATALRYRSSDEKARMTERFVQNVLPLLNSGQVKPVVDSVYPLEDVRAAHERMEANLNVGKIILRL